MTGGGVSSINRTVMTSHQSQMFFRFKGYSHVLDHKKTVSAFAIITKTGASVFRGLKGTVA
jgi:hypothetical protein